MATAAATGWWEEAKAAVATYTGLSPAVLFTAVAVAAALYVSVSGLFARPPVPTRRREEVEDERAFEPLPPPVQLGEMTEEELRVYDGSDPKKPLLMAIKGQIYDVTQSRMFYGPGGPYTLFAGRDASRALAKMSFEPSDLTGDISGLVPCEVEALQEWEYKFMSKYVKVGTIKKTIPVPHGEAAMLAGISGSDIDASTMQSNHVLAPKENGATTSHGSAVEQPATEKSDVGVSTSSHEDAVEKLSESPHSDVKHTSSHEDAVGEPEETPGGVDLRNESSHEDAVGEPEETPGGIDLRNESNTGNLGEPKGTHDADEKNIMNPEDAVEKTKEARDEDIKSSRGHESSGEPREAPNVDETNTSGPQDALERPKEISGVEGR